MRNYITLTAIQGDVYDGSNVYVQTVYGLGAHSGDAGAQLDAYLGQLPGYSITRTFIGKTFWLVTRGFIQSYLTVSGPGAVVCSSFVYGTFQSSEQAIIGPGSPKYAKNWGYPSETRKKTSQLGNVTAPAVFQVIEQLQTLANRLLKSTDAGQQRIGAIILYEVGLAVSGRKTITAALTFLEPFLAQIK